MYSSTVVSENFSYPSERRVSVGFAAKWGEGKDKGGGGGEGSFSPRLSQQTLPGEATPTS